MRLGRVPSWAKDPSIGYKTINVRSETVATTPSAENRSNRSDASLIHSFSQNPIDMLELRCQQGQFGGSFARRNRQYNDQGHDSRTSFQITPEGRQAPPRHLQAQGLAK